MKVRGVGQDFAFGGFRVLGLRALGSGLIGVQGVSGLGGCLGFQGTNFSLQSTV